MNSAFILALLVSVAAAKVPAVFQPRGVVSPIEQCGGVGSLDEFRITGCTAPPCEMVPGTEYTIETDFTTREACDELGFRLFVMLNDRIHSSYDVPIPGSQVFPGTQYTVRDTLDINPVLSGQENVEIVIHIYCIASRHTEVCVGTDIRVP